MNDCDCGNPLDTDSPLCSTCLAEIALENACLDAGLDPTDPASWETPND